MIPATEGGPTVEGHRITSKKIKTYFVILEFAGLYNAGLELDADMF